MIMPPFWSMIGLNKYEAMHSIIHCCSICLGRFRRLAEPNPPMTLNVGVSAGTEWRSLHKWKLHKLKRPRNLSSFSRLPRPKLRHPIISHGSILNGLLETPTETGCDSGEHNPLNGITMTRDSFKSIQLVYAIYCWLPYPTINYHWPTLTIIVHYQPWLRTF